MSASGLSRAFVLHARRYGDTSQLVELFDREKGRAVCVAKGALTGKRFPRLQPFQPLLVALRGRGEVQNLTAAEIAGPSVRLSGKQLYCGLYINELVLKLTARDDPSSGLYDDYVNALIGLEQATPSGSVLRRFEVRLLHHLGHALVLDRDVNGSAIDPKSRYGYAVESGPERSEQSDAPFSGGLFYALAAGQFDDSQIQREARVFMRLVLDHYLNGKPIRSRDLFR